MKTPLVDGHRPDGPILIVDEGGREVAIPAAAFVGAVVALAARLPRRGHALQRCERPAEFLVSTCAAWVAGQTVVMPPTRLAADRDALASRFPDACELIDTDTDEASNERAPGAVVIDLATVWRDAGTSWPPPALPDELVAAMLFTSGSTREPRATTKSWGSLCRGAGTFARTFRIGPGDVTLAGTVSPQHMFGLEATVMATLRTGCALRAVRPRFAADLAELVRASALSGRPPLCLATTPLHLEHFHRALAALPVAGPSVSRIIVSTMPMSRELAARVESDWAVRVDEIYGSTECGMIAARRPAVDDAFSVGDGLRLDIDDDGSAMVSGGQLDAPVALDDRLAWVEPRVEPSRGRFRLEGRTSDMVKIAGKRTTLSALGDHLKQVEGVVDGVFFPSAVQPGRLGALAVAPTLSEAELRRRLSLVIDPTFMPRPLVLTSALPRDERGKLALTGLQRMIGEVTASPPGTSVADHDPRCDRIACECVVAPEHPSLAGHFPGHPLVPGVVLLGQVESALRERGLRIVACTRVKFLVSIAPAQPFALEVAIGNLDAVTFTMKLPAGVAVSGTLRCAAART